MKAPPMLLVFLAIIAAALFGYFAAGFVLTVFLLVFIPQKPIRNLSVDDVRKAGNRTLDRSIRNARKCIPAFAAAAAASLLAYPYLSGNSEAMTLALGIAAGSLFSLVLTAGFYDIYRNEARKREDRKIRKRFYGG